jgi:hypothetical protein
VTISLGKGDWEGQFSRSQLWFGNGLSKLALLRPGSLEILTNGFAIALAGVPASPADILKSQFQGALRPIGAIGQD